MAINPKILEAVQNNQKFDNSVKLVLKDLLSYEMVGNSWYRESYRNFIEKYYKQHFEAGQNHED